MGISKAGIHPTGWDKNLCKYEHTSKLDLQYSLLVLTCLGNKSVILMIVEYHNLILSSI